MVPPAEVAEARGHAELVPVVTGLAVDGQRRTWVRRRVAGEAMERVDLFDPTGEYLGTVAGDVPFPIDFLPDGRWVTIERDELDVDRVVVYDVRVSG